MNLGPDILPEKTLFDVLRDMWRAKFYMLGFVCVCLGAAFVFMSFTQKLYRAEMIIAPAGIMMAGFDISEGTIQMQSDQMRNSESFMAFEHIYSGSSVALVLLEDKDVNMALRLDKVFEVPKTHQDLSSAQLSDYLKKRVKLEPVSGTPLRRLVYWHSSQKHALMMVSRIHHIADEIIRARALEQVDGRIGYLASSLVKIKNPEHRRSLTALLMEQERFKMMASIKGLPFAATIIEPVSVSSLPKWPDPYLVYSLFILTGMFMGFVAYGIRHHGK